MDGDASGDSARLGDFAAASECLPTLRLRPLGATLAEHRTTGVIVVRYADDMVLGFQHRGDAERFLQDWRDRLHKFGLELHPDKTRLIEFGRYAAASRKQRGERKPETFNFLGFPHICGRARKSGTFLVLRKSIRKRLLAKLKQVKDELRVRMHQPLAEVGEWLRSVVQGYFNYHAVPATSPLSSAFGMRWANDGCACYNDAVRRAGCPGSTSLVLLSNGFHSPKSFIHTPTYVSTPSICGRSRMRETCTCGPMRGALGVTCSALAVIR